MERNEIRLLLSLAELEAAVLAEDNYCCYKFLFSLFAM
jgi:hypothetical protein